MKKLFVILTAIILCTAGCGKKDTPAPDTNNNNNNNNGGQTPTNPVIDKTFDGPEGSALIAATQTDGKIILGGSFRGAAPGFTTKIVRLNVNGDLDNTFNIDVDRSWMINGLTAIGLMPDGKIMIGGDFTVGGVKKYLIRLTATGALDNTFTSPNFNSLANVPPTINRILVLSADRMLIAGCFNTVLANGTAYNHVIKITAGGLLDTSFRVNLVGSNDLISVLQVSGDGKYYISGSFTWANGSPVRRHVARLNADGSIDTSFEIKVNIEGRFPGVPGGIFAIVVGADNKVIIGGDFTSIVDPNLRDGTYNYRQLARFTATGALDQTFKTAGDVYGYFWSIGILPDGRILAAGNSPLNTSGGKRYASLFSKDGELDTGFDLGYDGSNVQRILIQGDKYLLAGNFSGQSQKAIFRISIK